MEIDWSELRVAAIEAMRRAYAPYSKFPVGAAALVDDGRTVVGCNVENASYGLTLCAECGLVSALHATGGGRLVAVACVDAAGDALMPCGRCRQLLWENGGPECLVDAFPEPRRMADLLPHAFDVTDLDAVGSTPHAPVVPARLAQWRGRGTAFVHPDMVGGQRVWTAYWERSTGLTDAAEAISMADAADADAAETADAAAAAGVTDLAGVDDVDEGPGILEEAPMFADAAEAVAWGRARTPRVVVVDADGGTYWAGDGAPPAEIELRWPS
jgi:cytidine deaminase